MAYHNANLSVIGGLLVKTIKALILDTIEPLLRRYPALTPVERYRLSIGHIDEHRWAMSSDSPPNSCTPTSDGWSGICAASLEALLDGACRFGVTGA